MIKADYEYWSKFDFEIIAFKSFGMTMELTSGRSNWYISIPRDIFIDRGDRGFVLIQYGKLDDISL